MREEACLASCLAQRERDTCKLREDEFTQTAPSRLRQGITASPYCSQLAQGTHLVPQLGSHACHRCVEQALLLLQAVAAPALHNLLQHRHGREEEWEVSEEKCWGR